jgi:hypothetical protein
VSSDGTTALIGGFFDDTGVGAAWVFVNQLPTATVSLANTTITVGREGKAAIKLTCAGSAPSCEVALSPTAQRKVWTGWGWRKHSHTVTVAIGNASATIRSGETTTVDLHLNERGRILLHAGHGHLPATLTIVKRRPKPEEEQTNAVELLRQKAELW